MAKKKTTKKTTKKVAKRTTKKVDRTVDKKTPSRPRKPSTSKAVTADKSSDTKPATKNAKLDDKTKALCGLRMGHGGKRPGAGRKKAIHKQMLDEILFGNEDGSHELEPLMPLVHEVYLEALTHPNMAIAFPAAKDLMNRGFGRAPQSIDITHKGNVGLFAMLDNVVVGDVDSLADLGSPKQLETQHDRQPETNGTNRSTKRRRKA